MDATIMVVAPGQATAANTNAGTVEVKDTQSSEFGQLLAQNLNVNDAQTQSDPNSQAQNLLQGAGQLNQLILQIIGQQKPDELNEEKNVAIKDKSKDESALNPELATALLQILQNFSFEINKIQQESNGQPQSKNLQQLMANIGDANSLKGQVIAMFNQIINASDNLNQFMSKLEQVIQGLSAEVGQSDVKSAVINELSNFLTEIKQLMNVENGTGKVNSANQKTNNLNVTVKEKNKVQTMAKVEKTEAKAENAEANDVKQITEKNAGQKTPPKVIGLEKVQSQAKPNTDSKTDQPENSPNVNNLYANFDNAKAAVNKETVKNQTEVNLTKYSDTVFDQIVKKAEIALTEGSSEMKIQLQPDFLGKVNMQIKIEEGVVTAKFAAENMQVKQMIEANLNNLRQNLLEQGLKVDQLLVSVGQGNDFKGYQQQRQSKPGATGQNLKPGNVKVAIESEIATGQKVEKGYGYSQSTYDYVV